MSAHFCSTCGEALGPEDRFCTNCGAVQPSESSPAPQAPPPPPPAAAPAPPPPVTPVAATTATDDDRSKRTPLLIAIGVLAALVLVVGALALTRGGSDGDGDSEDVVLEAAAVEVPDPFTASVAVDEAPIIQTAAATTGSTAPAVATGAGGGAVKGSAPGLYGGTRDKGSCDPEKMISFLQSEPSKAAAWAKVQGITAAQIPTFVRGLTPVVLRRDTRVLNHGYRNGRATPRPAVLQAGTAVLVDQYGVPRVKCACGNPLAEPRPVTTSTRYTGTRWTGFDPANVVIVRVDVKVTVLVLVDIETGKPFDRPIGTTGSDDADASGATTTSTTTTTEGGTTSEGTSAPVLFEIASIAGVSNGPTAPSVATLPAARITAISTYHWNDAQGATPGTVSLKGSDGTVYGPFPTKGLDGQGGVPNATWVATTNFRVPAGTYTVVDSSPGTWSYAPDTNGRGMTTIHGIAESAPATTTTTHTPATAPPSSDDRSDEAIAAVEGTFCATPGIDDDWRNYITQISATETEFQLYRVEVRIELDSGGWTALFDVDFATEGGPEIRPVNDESGDLMC